MKISSTFTFSRKAMEFESLMVFVIMFMIWFVLAAESEPLTSVDERLALLDLRSSLGIRAKDWPIKSNPCSSWTGIHCQNGVVTGINISGLKRTRLGRLNPQFSVDSLANLTRLVSFNASKFSLPGPIPAWFGYRLGSLQVLDLRSCSVTGSIPVSLPSLSSLHSLYLADNGISGNIPDTLGQLKSLTIVDLSKNRLTGSIPSSFSSNITSLNFASNYLHGSIPASLGSVHSLQVMNLSDNSLTASIPNEFGKMSMLVELDLSRNSLSGSLPVEFGQLKSLKVMNVANNKLEGPVTSILFNRLHQLEIVDLSVNRLDGAIPTMLLSLPKLHVVNLSQNNLTGSFPSFGLNAANATFNLSNNMIYGSLNVSYWNDSLIDLSGNYIQGNFPGDARNVIRNCLQNVPNQRSSNDCKMFYAERGLPLYDMGVSEPTQSPSPETEPKRSKRWIFILSGLFGGLIFIAILVLVLVLVLRRGVNNQIGSSNVGPIPEGGDNINNPQLPKDPEIVSSLGEQYSYEKLHQSTGGFNEANLIRHGHSGNLYRGVSESGAPIVVKKVDLNSHKKESYMTELDVFSKVSHTRLVSLLGLCLEHETEKFLVYKYMPNGDLGSSLFRVSCTENDNLQSLDWITRLKIATGTAEVLTYLHHECSPPLVHRDVQASSILLDDKFEVRLGSLSEVCVQEGDSHQSMLSRFMRRPSLTEPGSLGSSSATCAYDVFCFGKVLLELVTGKIGISKSDDATTKEWLEHTLPFISLNDKELVTKVVDPSLIVDEDLLEEVWAMAIVARSCLNPKPYKRPPMKYILKALENPVKVVREENFTSGRLRTMSSRRSSWSNAFFGSWRQSSFESGGGHGSRGGGGEGISGLKQSGRIGSHGSGRYEYWSSSHKRLSNEIFPEPVEIQDLERPDEQ
ncbi:probable LRR receptor-like serine/threonine-protein kinase At2g16250 [Rutidosis leptorrhynchoides]|uniref:probable LRR receptor-like serine/threonine-protein kinase At2g16250 n=1 Tax=Rutidosis leptorrhynchoides TaxID=125765 RepID=UPI003A99F1CF